jgi:hypothetical protein
LVRIEAEAVFSNAAVRAVLQLIYPDRPPVILAGLGENEAEKKAKKRARTATKSKAGRRRAA